MKVDVNRQSIDFNLLGGVVDLYVFQGDSPAAVTKQLADVIGRPSMVPYWSLGFRTYYYFSIFSVA